MIYLRAMTDEEFEKFKVTSQREYATGFAECEGIEFEKALKGASEQFDRMITNGLQTPGHLFFQAIEEKSGESIGFLWLGIQDRLGRKVTSINDIFIQASHRGNGYGKALMKCVEHEAQKAGSKRIRLHVFQHNETARNLYTSMGFHPTNSDMVKLI